MEQDHIINTTCLVGDNLFRISRNGTVYKRKRTGDRLWHPCKVGKINRKDSAYRYVGIKVNTHYKRYGLHRLMAEAFVINPDPARYTYVLPVDGDLTHTDPENLYWADKDMFYKYKFKRRMQLQTTRTKNCQSCHRRFRKNMDSTDQCPRCSRVKGTQTVPCRHCHHTHNNHAHGCCHGCFKRYIRKAERLNDYHYLLYQYVDRHALTDYQNACIDLRMQDKSYPEIAGIMQVTHNQIKNTFSQIFKHQKQN